MVSLQHKVLFCSDVQHLSTSIWITKTNKKTPQLTRTLFPLLQILARALKGSQVSPNLHCPS